MSEYIDAGGGAATEPADDVGGWPVGNDAGAGWGGDPFVSAQPEPEWAGPSPDEWQATQQALGAIAQLLTGVEQQEQQPGVDPFAEDFEEQLRAKVSEEIAPILAYVEQQQSEQEAHRVGGQVTEHWQSYANEIGVDASEAQIAAGALHRVELEATNWLMSPAGADYLSANGIHPLTPEQAKQAVGGDPGLAANIVALAYGNPGEPLHAAVPLLLAGRAEIEAHYNDARRAHTPHGVLAKYTRAPAPVDLRGKLDSVTEQGKARIRARARR